jgi:hypothetical protein
MVGKSFLLRTAFTHLELLSNVGDGGDRAEVLELAT